MPISSRDRMLSRGTSHAAPTRQGTNRRNKSEAMFVLGALLLLSPRDAEAKHIPYWARKYDVACSQCHVSVPRLNGFGAEFLARGYRMPSDSAVTARWTVPLAVW